MCGKAAEPRFQALMTVILSNGPEILRLRPQNDKVVGCDIVQWTGDARKRDHQMQPPGVTNTKH